MVMSTFQKVTLATCLVLCVALLLPRMLLSRGRKDASATEGGHPPMVHRHMAPEGRGQRVAAGSGPSSGAHKAESVAARPKGAGAGGGLGTAAKSNLAGQIIPVYGFGILLYILYILFKITSKGSSPSSLGRFSSVRSENTKRKITDFELVQLQEKLRETEMVMENIVSNVQRSPDRGNNGVNVDQESLLHQLTEITRVMQEGQLVEGVATTNKKDQRAWEEAEEEDGGDSWERPRCGCCQHCGSQTQAGEDDGGDPGENDLAGFPGAHPADEEPGAGSGGKEDSELEQQDVHLSGKEQRERVCEEERIQLGVPKGELAGVLKELELTLKMTSLMEREKMDRLETQASAGGGAIRRRRKRRSRESQ